VGLRGEDLSHTEVSSGLEAWSRSPAPAFGSRLRRPACSDAEVSVLETLAQFQQRGLLALVAAAIALGVGSSRSEALEFFDGRIQAHGFAEMQIRVLDEQFDDNLDLSQWYNVLNLEVEADILPDGWGPIDLLRAYVPTEIGRGGFPIDSATG